MSMSPVGNEQLGRCAREVLEDCEEQEGLARVANLLGWPDDELHLLGARVGVDREVRRQAPASGQEFSE
eukprot:10731675-Heterocapsa_arctica.AAC.1